MTSLLPEVESEVETVVVQWAVTVAVLSVADWLVTPQEQDYDWLELSVVPLRHHTELGLHHPQCLQCTLPWTVLSHPQSVIRISELSWTYLSKRVAHIYLVALNFKIFNKWTTCITHAWVTGSQKATYSRHFSEDANWISTKHKQQINMTIWPTGCGRKNSPIWEANKFKTKEDMANAFLFLESTQNAILHQCVLNKSSLKWCPWILIHWCSLLVVVHDL